MGILGKSELLKLYKSADLLIETLDKEQPFDADRQVTEDGIDLRLSVSGLRYKPGLREVDTLFEGNLDNCFEEVSIPVTGYRLSPNDVLFGSTLEVVCLATSRFSGRVFGRSTFARFGLSVHCTQPKFPPGLAWTFPLQLVNHNSIPLVIYPYSYLVQLQIETTFGDAVAYEGKYDRDVTLHPPKIDKRELAPLNSATDNVSLIHTIQTEHVQELRNIVAKYEIDDRRRVRFKRGHLVLLRIVSATMSAGFIGYAGNLLSNPDVSYYKTALIVVSFVFGVISLVALAMFSIWKYPGEA